MVNFNNIQEALNFPLGQVEGAKAKVTIGDYLDVIDSSGAFTRLFTQISLYLKGKGWITQAKAKQMIQTVDLETLNSITNICKRIITRLSEIDHPQGKSIGFKLSKTEEYTVLKEMKSLGSHRIDSSIQTIIQEMQLLRGWIGEERISRHRLLVQLMGHWSIEQFEIVRNDHHLKVFFLQFVSWANQWGFEYPPGTLGEAVKYLNGTQAKLYYQDGNFDLDKLDTSHFVTRTSILMLVSGFKEWLVWSLETGKFDEEQKRCTIDGLCSINPRNEGQIRLATLHLPTTTKS